MEPDQHLAHLRADVDRLLAAAPGVLEEPVTACPGWTVEDLLWHLAGVYRFATAQLRAEPGSDLAPFDPPDQDRPVLEVVRGAADEVLAALGDTDPAEHRPNWADEPAAAFWFRRLALETVVHRVDAELAAGTPGPVDAALACDGIDELHQVFLVNAERRGIVGAGETVHLHATDEGLDGGEWMFTFRPDGVDVEHHHGKGDMAVRGPAGQLLLFAWNRRPVDLTCFGEPDPLAFWAATVRI
jgi:uncharacterized protein (TIGR03083 family)